MLNKWYQKILIIGEANFVTLTLLADIIVSNFLFTSKHTHMLCVYVCVCVRVRASS